MKKYFILPMLFCLTHARAQIITTIAGDGTKFFCGNGNGGQATAASIAGVSGIMFDKKGNMFIATGGDSILGSGSSVSYSWW